jgi:hypothetical protein
MDVAQMLAHSAESFKVPLGKKKIPLSYWENLHAGFNKGSADL